MGVPTNHTVSGDGLPEKTALGTRAEMIFRALLADTMKQSGKSRAQIADELTQILGGRIAKNVLDDCVRSRRRGRKVRFPAAWIPALCEVTGSDEPQRHLLSGRLRHLLVIGENVTDAARSLACAQEAVAQLTKQAKRHE